MKIILAPQSYKGSLKAHEAAEAMAQGVKAANPDIEVVSLPIADGGSGTVKAMVEATGGRLRRTEAEGPLGDPVRATWGILGDGQTAVIEMSAASGLSLVPEPRRDALKASTYGTGQLIKAALEHDCRNIVVGLGDSATTDGGAGMAEALGIRLLDETGTAIPRGGGGLAGLHRIDMSGLHPGIADVSISGACDVTNPLYGPEGAAHVYGPQKGATPEIVGQLDANLRHLAEVISRDVGKDIATLPGGGAAGGIGAGLVAFLGAELKSGADLVCDAIGFDDHLDGADLVLVGEGRIDFQTAFGKTAVGIARRAKKKNIPVVALCGQLGDGYRDVYEHGIDAAMSILPGCIELEEAMRRGGELLTAATEAAVRVFMAGFRS